MTFILFFAFKGKHLLDIEFYTGFFGKIFQALYNRWIKRDTIFGSIRYEDFTFVAAARYAFSTPGSVGRLSIFPIMLSIFSLKRSID